MNASASVNPSSDQTETLTDGFHVLAEALKANGLDTLYGVIGIPVTDVARIAQAKGIRYIGMRHEADAANAAAAHGYLTGAPGAFLTVSAPGFLNGLAPLREATENGFPCIQFGGSSDRATVDLQEGQYEGLDQRAYAVPFAKASYRIDRIEDIGLGVVRAIRAASSGRPGGVYVDLPDSLLSQTMDAQAAKETIFTALDPAPAMIPSEESVERALELLEQAKNPLIFLGKGAAYARADEEIADFIHKTGIPYQPMSMAKGLLPDDDPQCTASCRGLAMRTADVVLMIGARLNWMLGFGKGRHWNPDVKFIQIDIDPVEIENARPIAAPIVGDIKSTMKLMVEGLAHHAIHASAEWQQLLDADTKKNDARFGSKTTEVTDPMNHYNALGAVKEVIDAHQDVIIVNEGANTLDDCRDIVAMYKPRQRLDCGTWGVMGIGTGYAIAAAVATGKSVVSIHGDSAFGFDGMEVETICRYKLPVTVMVFNNGGIYRGDFENLGTDGDPSPLTLDATAHYEKMMEAFGGKGYYATTPAEVKQYLSEAIESKAPALIHVQLSIHSGVESGHISDLNPQPIVGPLAGGHEMEDLNEKVVDGKLVQESPAASTN